VAADGESGFGAHRHDHRRHKAKMDDFVSIIGITQMIAQQMGQRFVEGLELAAKISALLGFFNLLPLPALDGGRLVFLSIEVITRRRVNHRIEQIVHMVGMVILLGLMLLLVAKDLVACLASRTCRKAAPRSGLSRFGWGRRSCPAVRRCLRSLQRRFCCRLLPGVRATLSSQVPARARAGDWAAAVATSDRAAHRAESVCAVVFIGLLLWSIGAAIEQRIKARRFVAWSAAVLLTASLTVALLGRLHALTKSAAGQLPIPIEGAPIFGMVLLGFAQLYGGLQVRMWGVDQLTSGRTLAGFFIAIGLWRMCCAVSGSCWERTCVTLALTFVLLTDHGGQSVWSVWKTLRSKLPSKGRRPRKFEVIDGGGGGGSSRHNHDSARKWLN
jgi:hypothetical protein